jgi:UDP-glucose 4-epimerase
MKVVITGATGHIGQSLVPLLKTRGHEVIGLSSSIDIAGDASVARLAPLLDGAVVVHLAAWHPPATASTTAAERRRLLDVNVYGTCRVLDAARGKAAAVIVASTFEVYGEPHALPIDEDHPTFPLNDYGVTKLSAEDHAFAFAEEEHIRVVCLRMPAVYGPGEKTPRLLPNSIAKVARGEAPVIEGDGGDLRDFLYVDDAALAFALAAESNVRGIFNVADGAKHSVDEVVRTAMKIAGMTGEPAVVPRKKTRRDYHMSIERASQLGFAPQVSLEEGMRRQLEALR